MGILRVKTENISPFRPDKETVIQVDHQFFKRELSLEKSGFPKELTLNCDLNPSPTVHEP
ncbi:unnamed protein product, partial [Allacma fusca]